jgi:hypothetical protein
MPLLNKSGYWYFDTLGQYNDELVKQWREVSLVTRIHDWDNDPDDYYLIEFKSVISLSMIDYPSLIPADQWASILDPDSRTFLILENFHEGFSFIIPQLYDSLDKFNIPPHKCLLWTGALDLQELLDEYITETKREPFGLVSMLEFEFATKCNYEADIEQQGLQIPKTLQPNREWPKKYLNFNRRWRLHRPMLTAMLKVTDLLDYGYVSLAKSDDERDWIQEWDHLLEESRDHAGMFNAFWHNKAKIQNMGDLILDKTDLSVNQAQLELTDSMRKLYEDTYFSVVSETIFFTKLHEWEESCFLSEKIFKAIVFKHPFILVATPDTLKYLKALGYKTFSPVIDESYDSIEDNLERMVAITKEINRLCKLKGQALEDFLDYCRGITEHNFKVLTNKQTFIYRH